MRRRGGGSVELPPVVGGRRCLHPYKHALAVEVYNQPAQCARCRLLFVARWQAASSGLPLLHTPPPRPLRRRRWAGSDGNGPKVQKSPEGACFPRQQHQEKRVPHCMHTLPHGFHAIVVVIAGEGHTLGGGRMHRCTDFKNIPAATESQPPAFCPQRWWQSTGWIAPGSPCSHSRYHCHCHCCWPPQGTWPAKGTGAGRHRRRTGRRSPREHPSRTATARGSRGRLGALQGPPRGPSCIHVGSPAVCGEIQE